ncbi:GSCFA domain-containing protein [Flavobacterium sp.]|uniref:GSCFA domain-containing protein n=1 Tax=Flavobacterium sp. TaxID=239 RepID=UPI00121860B6|nr:GSCFA domain-containing protein [Flavobacterium sp.]RZJ73532.1 MAG: GSCFA domain-containing protein [Flavobacterium sp.]
MQFTTPVPISKSDFAISYESQVFSIGSCFAENISRKFDHFGFRNTVNPFGILFHPLALGKFLGFLSDGKVFDESDVFFHNERWHCFDAHSDLSHSDKGKLISQLTEVTSGASEKLKNATHVIITLGTAWVYRENASGNLVANCHKVPQREFSKEILSVDAISASVKNMVKSVSEVNPKAQIIFTISPVRHLKDGFVENQRSKANLISGLHSAIGNFENCRYFPSYEIVMDELRDYRFYASDMLHPNQIAIDYIWEKFASAWVSESAFADMAEVDSIRKALAHRPFNLESEQHLKFVQNTQNRILQLRNRLSFLTFD